MGSTLVFGERVNTNRRYLNADHASVGDEHCWSKSFHWWNILFTMIATGDNNPIHWNRAFAAKTQFKRPILHGVATIGEISKILGKTFPGHGTIFVELESKFRQPVYPGDTVDFSARVEEITAKKMLIIAVEAKVGEVVTLRGKAKVFLAEHIE